MNSRYLWILLAVLALFMVPGAAQANIIDLPAGTSITNSCTVSWGTTVVNDSASIGRDTTVATIRGDSLYKPVEAADANVGDTTVFEYVIHNTGNATDSYQISFMAAPIYIDGGSGVPSNWIFEIGNGTDSITYGYGGTPTPADSITVGAVTEDGIGRFWVAVQPSGVAAEAPNGSVAGCSFTVCPVSYLAYGLNPTLAYTGDNTYSYAEDVPTFGTNNFGNDTVTIAAAVFAVTKDCTSVLAGADWTPVPGASLNFLISYTNSGAGAGRNVTIYDQVDTSVVMYQEPVSTPAGWTFQVGPSDVTDFSYGSAQFVADGAITDDTVRWVRWTKANVASAESGELVFRTTIY